MGLACDSVFMYILINYILRQLLLVNSFAVTRVQYYVRTARKRANPVKGTNRRNTFVVDEKLNGFFILKHL
jgi:hypothetical protein